LVLREMLGIECLQRECLRPGDLHLPSPRRFDPLPAIVPVSITWQYMRETNFVELIQFLHHLNYLVPFID
jgi:hypothetical protein